MFYESKNSLHPDLIRTESGTDFSFPPHLHGSFELITVWEGEMQVTVDKIQYTLTPGSALLVFPNQVHALTTEEHSRHFLCIFSPQLVQAFGKIYLSRIPESNLFRPDPYALTRLSEKIGEESILRLKGLLYTLCADFDDGAVYREQAQGEESLPVRIFRFAEREYQRDCSLTALSRETSYHPAYLSRFFKQCTGISFTEYVNRYRIGEACGLLTNTDAAILQIAYDCGFDSLRSFNRNFTKIMAMTPSAYRRCGMAAHIDKTDGMY